MSEEGTIEIQLGGTFATARAQSDATDALSKTLTAHLRTAGLIDVARTVNRVRDNREAQDQGTVVGVVLAAPAIVQIAKGIADFIRGLAPKNRKIILKRPGGRSLQLDNPTKAELTAALEAFLAA
jgi:hypothetical protein